MKTSILAFMALLAAAALGANGVHGGYNLISNHAPETSHLVTADPVVDERTWVPFRALRSMDSPKQGPHDDGKHLPHDPKKDSKHDSPHHRSLGQAHVTPAPTTATTKATPAPTKTASSTSKATPAPTKTAKPEATPAATTTAAAATPCHTTTSNNLHKLALPPVGKKPTAPSTKTGKTGTSTTSNAVQRMTRNLGGDEAKQGVKNGVKHQ